MAQNGPLQHPTPQCEPDGNQRERGKIRICISHATKRIRRNRLGHRRWFAGQRRQAQACRHNTINMGEVTSISDEWARASTGRLPAGGGAAHAKGRYSRATFPSKQRPLRHWHGQRAAPPLHKRTGVPPLPEARAPSSRARHCVEPPRARFPEARWPAIRAGPARGLCPAPSR